MRCSGTWIRKDWDIAGLHVIKTFQFVLDLCRGGWGGGVPLTGRSSKQNFEENKNEKKRK